MKIDRRKERENNEKSENYFTEEKEIAGRR